MYLLAPDILAEARGLSIFLSAVGLVLGALLWLFGWVGHRFWVVLTATVLAGVWGLANGPVHGLQPLVVALMLGVAVGALALALVRVVIFAAAGLASWLLVHYLVPAWDEPLLCMLSGGLVGLLLFRFWTMALTSLCGTLLMGYSLLLLLDTLGRINAPEWATRNAAVLNWTCSGLALFGWLLQFLMEARREAFQRQIEEAQRKAREEEIKKEKERREKEKQKELEKKKEEAKAKAQKPPPSWGWMLPWPLRRAG